MPHPGSVPESSWRLAGRHQGRKGRRFSALADAFQRTRRGRKRRETPPDRSARADPGQSGRAAGISGGGEVGARGGEGGWVTGDLTVAGEATPLDQIGEADLPRRACGIGEFDRILGGGIVPGSAVLVGGTFMVATMAGLQLARELAPQNPTPLLARMTVAFASGQIAGPLLVRWLGTERVGGHAAVWWGNLAATVRWHSPRPGWHTGLPMPSNKRDPRRFRQAVPTAVLAPFCGADPTDSIELWPYE